MSRVDCVLSQANTQGAEPHFVIGQDTRGCWLAVETHNLAGGLFKSREDAVHFVAFETDHRPGAIEFATAPLQLPF